MTGNPALPLLPSDTPPTGPLGRPGRPGGPERSPAQQPVPPPAGPSPADVLLTDGSVAVLRALRAEDRDQVAALHDEASDATLRLRFFATGRHAGAAYVAHLFAGLFPDQSAEPADAPADAPTDAPADAPADRPAAGPLAALVATVRGRVVGLATAERVGPDAAEVAFLVADAMHGRGLGSLLLEHLAAAARDRGVRRFVAEVLPENRPMLEVLLDAGFEVSRRSEDGGVHVELGTAATARAVAAADERERLAETRSLRPLLYPRSVAVVGVRRDGTGIGAAVLRSVRAGGFRGPVHVVHPDAGRIAHLRAHRRLVDVPGPVDLVVVAVPAAQVLDVVRDAAAAGASAAVVLTAGFGELGEDGKDLQAEMLRVAREHSLRLVGPNCLGLMSNQPDVRLNATFARGVPPTGGLAVATQSGGVGIALVDQARRIGLGIGSFVSLGNKADVSGNDLLAAWQDDPRVTAAALYLESFGNAPKFARVARRFAERKPLLAVVGGLSAGGRRAGASHTAAAASPAVGVEALFAQAGVIACRTAEELAATALLVTEQDLPPGPRVGIISNAGGLGVLAADEAEARGLVVPELSAELRTRVARHVTATAGTANPVDTGAAAGPAELVGVVEALLDSDEVDALLVVLVGTSITDPAPLLRALADHRVEDRRKSVVLVPMGGVEVPEDPMPGLTVLPDAPTALTALLGAARYAAWRRSRHDAPSPTDEETVTATRARAADLVIRTRDHDGWLSVDQARQLLAAYSLVPAGLTAATPAAAATAASHVGFPVAVKVADQEVVHRTERGLVRVGLRSPVEVRAAARGFATALGREEVTVLVQPVVNGVELAIGVVRDPGFGPLVMVAAGGVTTDLLADRAFLLPPVRRAEAARALRSLRTWPLLCGYRGSPGVDVTEVERLVVAVGALAVDVPQLAELDLNPVIATPDGCALVDVKVRVAAAPVLDAGVPRRLRSPR